MTLRGSTRDIWTTSPPPTTTSTTSYLLPSLHDMEQLSNQVILRTEQAVYPRKQASSWSRRPWSCITKAQVPPVRESQPAALPPMLSPVKLVRYVQVAGLLLLQSQNGLPKSDVSRHTY